MIVLTGFSQQVQDQRHARQTISRKIDARIDNAAVALATNDGTFFLHLFSYVNLAYPGKKKRTTKSVGDLLKY